MNADDLAEVKAEAKTYSDTRVTAAVVLAARDYDMDPVQVANIIDSYCDYVVKVSKIRRG